MTVLGKGAQQYVDASLPPQAVTALDRYRRVLDPPTDEWPVFPTQHRETLAAHARQALREATDSDADAIDARLAADGADAVLRDLEAPPPSLTTDGLRYLLKQLSDAADVPGLDSESGEYLEPHGGRHGAGDTLVREVGWEAAQDLLRHKSPETTMDTYSHIEASETAAAAGAAFDRVDGGGGGDGATESGDADDQ
jgi:integrase